MLNIVVPGEEFWDEKNQEFIYTNDTVLLMEHSLLSISKWESKWHKSFISNSDKLTPEELLDYVKCMVISKDVPDMVYSRLTKQNLKDIEDYISDPMTATTFSNNNQRKSREIITSEIVYYWMVEFGIPFECQKWHFNRLLTLIQVCSIKNQPSKKMSGKDVLSSNAALNAARRKAHGTRG